MRAFLQRPYHFFISYSHEDSAFAKDLNHWLSERAGLRTWFDQSDLRSGDRVHGSIAASIQQCQGIIFLLSQKSVSSRFVQEEVEQARAEEKVQSRFQIVLLRLDGCDIAGQCPALRIFKWHELATTAGPKLSLQAAAEILCRLHAYEGWQSRQGELKEVYISRGWRDGEDAFADELCRRLASHRLRLVGDLPNQDKNDLHRIEDILHGCWGHVLILPPRTSSGGPEAAYKYFLQEWNRSKSIGVPSVVFTEPDSVLPPSLAEQALPVLSEYLSGPNCTQASPLNNHLYDFVDRLVKPKKEVHAFFSSEYQDNVERNSLARAVVEATGTLPCYWGKDFGGTSVSSSIRDAIASAKFVVADLTSPGSAPADKSQANVNSCIEAAIAWGANVRLLLLAAANPLANQATQEGKTRHVPFMFRNAQLDLYDDNVASLAPGVEFLGAVHKAVLEDRTKFGRRVINYEL